MPVKWAKTTTSSRRTNFVVDSTTEVLLERMQNIARLIGVVSLLVALPLLWMAWVLAANLAGLLMLNERRTLGLMRLRGISGRLMGRALLISVTLGGLGGGLLGLLTGSVVPLLIYERGHLPLGVLLDGRQLAIFGAFLADLGRARPRREPAAGEVRDDDFSARGVGTGFRV